ncbi:hypothetical protein [Curtobacterium sp. SL109]|uniref:hypothetical protein n=1 Tax=Curtobacterium sp. SL109 TaxID=2994662 RepID=UPI0022737BFA|nr:hypothetical protein [Curtobacterium sp. SL109]MCY1695268.1 hypothetical protein [Curtobacterium sp. SL109]
MSMADPLPGPPAGCGFGVAYSRPEERFAYIALGSAHLMLEQAGVGRNWITGPLELPLGRGINLQITVPDTAALTQVLGRAGVDLFMAPEIPRPGPGRIPRAVPVVTRATTHCRVDGRLLQVWLFLPSVDPARIGGESAHFGDESGDVEAVDGGPDGVISVTASDLLPLAFDHRAEQV